MVESEVGCSEKVWTVRMNEDDCEMNLWEQV